MRCLLLLPAAIALGCTAQSDVLPTCDTDDEQEPGLVADVNDADWDAPGGQVQINNAAGLNLVFTVDAQNTMSIRLRASSTWEDVDGEAVRSDGDALVAENALTFGEGDLPLGVALGDAAQVGGDATLVFDGQTHHSSDADGGYLRLATWDEDDAGAVTLRGCLTLEAGASDGHVASLSDGSFAVLLP